MFRIVLCDDSPADLMVLCGHLEQLKEKRPVDIISYTDGLDLLKDYKQKGFCDILVLDMRMKTMGGIEVAKHIRRLDDEVPIRWRAVTFCLPWRSCWTGSRRNRHPSSPSPA